VTRAIGGVAVGPVGLGAMPLSVGGRPDEADAVAVVHAALDAGVRLIDTADAYALGHDDVGHGERLVAAALRAWGGDADDVLVATKGGHVRPPGDGWELDGRPEHLRRACEASLRALGTEAIGLYQLHRPDPDVPFAESVGALRDLRDAGMVRLVGVSNVDVAQIDEARAILGEGDGGLASVQNELSPAFRSSEGELEHCARHGIAFLPWSPLGGIGGAASLGGRLAAFAEVAAARGVSAQRVCLAWLLAKAPVVVAIPGASRPATIRDSAASGSLVLEPAQLAALDAATA
jgi:aryl-alcohol dehydrogenase-like predicted oxidoreductase